MLLKYTRGQHADLIECPT